MRVLVIADSHMFRTPDNQFWCRGITGRDFFMRYCTVFDQVRVVCRVQDVEQIDKDKYLRVDDARIQVFPMPFARGTKEYLLHLREILRAAKQAVADCECAIFRVPSVIAYFVYGAYRRIKKPYAIEVVVDPNQAYSGAVRMLFVRLLKKMALSANGASYVTHHVLQEKFPSYARLHGESAEHFESYYSSIDLYPEFLGEPKHYTQEQKSFVISHTANKSASMVKGQDVLIRALGRIVKAGWDVRVRFIGDSEIKEKYYAIAKECGVEDRIAFTGMLAGANQIREELISSDLFVLPTKAEGLPRSIIEAMAVGLPCVSTPIDGVTELVEPEYLVEQSDDKALAEKIVSLLGNKPLMEQMSKNNIETAKEYLYDTLSARRTAFYQKLYDLGER
nr:glycosyltransferase family 4 protein [bacterium]